MRKYLDGVANGLMTIGPFLILMDLADIAPNAVSGIITLAVGGVATGVLAATRGER